MAKTQYADLPQYYGAYDTEAAANGGVIAQVPSSLTTRDKVGILIHSLQWLPEDFKTGGIPYAATADAMVMGITQLYNGGVVPDFNAPGVIDWRIVGRIDYGASTATGIWENPFEVRFPTPRLAHPAALYWFFQGVNMPAARTMNFRMEYSYRDLSDREYQDIIQTIVLQNAL